MPPALVPIELPSEQACVEYLERLRWPDGVRCINPSYCGSPKICRFTARKSKPSARRDPGEVAEGEVPERRLYECMKCGYQFTVTTGTLFHRTHLPLRKWFLAVALILSSGERITTRQMKRHLNVSQKSAWLLTRRLYDALAEPDSGAAAR